MDDVIQQLEDLRSFGYTPVRRSFGGPFVLRAPGGRVVQEENFAREIETLLMEKDPCL